MTKLEELYAAHQYFEYLWLCRDAGDTYSIGSGDDIIATSTSESLARFTALAHNLMPALLEAVDVIACLRRDTGHVVLMPLDQVERINAVLEKLK